MPSLRSFLNAAFVVGLAAAAALSATHCFAQSNGPHIAYVYPAGGRQGDSFQVTLGGKNLNFPTDGLFSGDGVHAKVLDYVKPLNRQQANKLKERVQELEKKKSNDPNTIKQIDELKKKIGTFQKDLNPAFAELVTLEVHIDADAEIGNRDLRLATATGLSNPMVFQIGQLAEMTQKNVDRTEEADKARSVVKGGEPKKSSESKPPTDIKLPVTLNGQIMPSETDRYTFHATKGQRVVVEVQARALIPFLADAVPGWFQTVAAVYDASGKELAYDDHYRFHPDPVLYCKIPRDGQYVLEIRDSLYRGREDFVYRVSVGEIPFIASVFPLGGPAGKQTAVELKGWNLPDHPETVDGGSQGSRTIPLSVRKGKLVSNSVPFSVDVLPECLEEEPNNEIANAQALSLPIIVNGRIDPPGDWDVFRIEGHADQKIVAEVDARKLESPLDSILKLTDAKGQLLVQNDDADDKETGLSTHHADSRIIFTLPADGVYYLHLGDAQRKGGPDFAYRLRVSAPQPDFALQVEPSSVSVRSSDSMMVKVHAVRKDGFSGEIAIALAETPSVGEKAESRWTIKRLKESEAPPPRDTASRHAKKAPGNVVQIDAGAEETQFKLIAPRESHDDPIRLSFEGRATIDEKQVTRVATPTDDLMQAFIYHHLVPAQETVATIIDRGPPKIYWKLQGEPPLKIPAGGTASVQLSASQTGSLPQLHLVLHDPLAGFSIDDVTSDAKGIAFVLRADATELKPGYKGNLGIDVILDRPAKSKNEKAKGKNRRMPFGSLPNIAFEITEPK
jgi:hypothetical protein